ncbi:hypothetical protein LSH36_14g10031 [Paralvinella palmiformis]|uniref:Fatty acid hydroxylase domain-containing protein n=1 Tax=Paralvinella palmiformis TaxID=53620 RepID=A0AAD9KCS1_9ANNE|nr:hypothetical protein LSH36_14g10031 [Paralvinella palmiformis]
MWQILTSFCQHQWERIYEMFDGDQSKMVFIGTFLVSSGAFFGVNLFLSILDLTGFPQRLVKYKIQKDKNCPVSRDLFLKALGWVIFNQTVVAFPIFFLSHIVMVWRGCSFGRQLPTLNSVFLDIAVCTLIEEILFYYSHRYATFFLLLFKFSFRFISCKNDITVLESLGLFHHRFLYKHIHKMHHEWTAPIGITAIYAHPLEHIVCNILPAIAGPIIMGSHVVTSWLWFTIALISTTVAHCGYHFPLIPSPEFHDYHHLKFVNNFGVLGILDRLHGTDSQFRASDAFKRHLITFSLTPVSLQFPDTCNEKKMT